MKSRIEKSLFSNVIDLVQVYRSLFTLGMNSKTMTRRRRNVWVPRQRRHSVVCHADASGIVITNTVNVMRRIHMKTILNLKTRSSWFNCTLRGDEADN